MLVSVFPYESAHSSTIVSSPLMFTSPWSPGFGWRWTSIDPISRSRLCNGVGVVSIQSNQMNWLSIIELYLATVTYLLLALPGPAKNNKYEDIWILRVFPLVDLRSRIFDIYLWPEFLLKPLRGDSEKNRARSFVHSSQTSDFAIWPIFALKLPNKGTSWWWVRVFSWAA